MTRDTFGEPHAGRIYAKDSLTSSSLTALLLAPFVALPAKSLSLPARCIVSATAQSPLRIPNQGDNAEAHCASAAAVLPPAF